MGQPSSFVSGVDRICNVVVKIAIVLIPFDIRYVYLDSLGVSCHQTYMDVFLDVNGAFQER